MRILAVAPWVPTTRRPRSRELLTMLAEKHDVHLLCAAWSADEAVEAQALPFPVTAVRVNKIRGVLGALSALVRGGSLQQGFVSTRRLRDELLLLTERLEPDAYYFNVIRVAHLAHVIPERGALKVIDLDEVRSNYYALMRSSSKSAFWRLVAFLEQRRMARAEEVASGVFDKLLFSSPTDLRNWPEKSLLVRTPSPSSLAPDPAPEPPSGQSIVFVGRLGYRANAEAISWFVKEVWPALSRLHPRLHLYIVGEAPGRRTRRLSSERVHVTGRVPSVAPYYAGAAACIVPVSMATGVQLKLIEAMHIGTPAVVSPVVAHGAGVESGREVLIASMEPGQWVDALDRLLTDRSLAIALASTASTWVSREYAPDRIAGTLRSAFERRAPARAEYRG